MINKNKGFTLIELLVVISIIGLLSTVVLSSLSGARTKAINSTISQEVQNRQVAMNLLLDNTDRSFPDPGNTASPGNISGISSYYCFAKNSTDCYFASTLLSSAPVGNGLYTLFKPKEEDPLMSSQLAGVSLPPQAESYYLNSYIPPASYKYGTVQIGPNHRNYSVGIFYRCAASTVKNGLTYCSGANIYWVQVGADTCKKGELLLSGGGHNNILCYQGADGNPPYGTEDTNIL